MYIDKIIISGFRSFKNCEISGLSQGQNVIVGPNGSGKSNIICAIEFVLTRNYSRLDAAQRQLLICQNNKVANKPRIVTAFVVLVFDNSDQRFPLNERKVAIKRQLSATSDQYFINNRLASYDEILAMLESGGFSINNSYYLVKQGVITEIAMSSPRYLLDILRSISGAKSFDEKKAKSFKLIAESEETIRKMEEKVVLIEDHLRLLNIDEDKIRIFNELNRIRRYLNAKSQKFELTKVEKSFQEIEQEKAELSSSLEEKQSELVEVEQQLKAHKEQIRITKQSIEYSQNKLDSTVALMEKILGEMCTLKTESEKEKTSDIVSQSSLNVEETEKQLEENQQNLQQYSDELLELEENEISLREKLEMMEQRKKNYYHLLNLENSATSQSEKDQLIRDKLKHLEEDIDQQQKTVTDYRSQYTNLKSKRQSIQKSIKNGKHEKKLTIEQSESKQLEISDLSCKIKAYEIKKRETFNELNLVQKEIMHHENELKELENSLDLYTSDMAVLGRKSIDSVLSQFKSRLNEPESIDPNERARLASVVNGYHGQLVDCFELTKPVYRALEALMKNKIFYHIVSSENVATELINEMYRQKLHGLFKFIALNRVSTKPHSLGDCEELVKNGENCQMLSSCFKLIDNLPPAKKESFAFAIQILSEGLFIGRSFELCVSLHDSSKNCDFCTLNGEMIDRLGVISRISNRNKTKFELYEKLRSLQHRLNELKQTLCQLEQDRDLLVKQSLEWQSRMSVLQNELINNKEKMAQDDGVGGKKNYEQLKRIYQLDEKIVTTKNLLSKIETKLSCLLEEKHFWESKLDIPLEQGKHATQEHKSLIEELTKQIHLLTVEFNQLLKKRTLKEIEIRQFKNVNVQLTEQLEQRKMLEINKNWCNENQSKIKCLYEELKIKVDQHRGQCDELNKKMNELTGLECELSHKLATNQQKYDQNFSIVEELKKKFSIKSTELEQMKTNMIKLRVDIEQNGTFTSDYINSIDAKYRQLKRQDIINRTLQDINRQLKKISQGRLNEETLKRYQEMKERVVSLVRLKEKQLANMDEIKQFISIIELKKQEIIMRTYKQVNIHFQQIFKQFVSQGSSCIQFLNGSTNSGSSINTSSQCSTLSQSQSLSSSNTGSQYEDITKRLLALQVDQFEGLEILVSFTSKTPDTDLISLSGGQKALVSLAFIFALQQVDPTPFYIFDEVDQNLDETYRNAVADIIRQQVTNHGKQFILTTFRKQFLQNSDKFFGVNIQNGISNVKEISKQMAIDFVSQIKVNQSKSDDDNDRPEDSRNIVHDGAGDDDTEIDENI